MAKVRATISTLVGLLSGLAMCFSAASGAEAAQARRERFDRLDGQAVEAVLLTNKAGMKARIIAYGATLQSLEVPDRNGRLDDIVLSFPDLAGFRRDTNYLGATVGRYANRIAKGAFTLEGHRYQLATNNGPNALHGGVVGFDKVLWTISDVRDGAEAAVTFSRVSKDMEEGYPGELTVDVTYGLNERNELTITYRATTTKSTIVNLTNHSYFNLSGASSGRDVLGQVLTLAADRFTPTDANLIPTGELRPVAGTAFDFRTPHRIGARIRDGAEAQLVTGKGYDQNWVLNGGVTEAPKLAARVDDPETGRTLDLLTTEPGVQFYTGNYLDGGSVGKGGMAYRQSSALCLEPQHFPDSPNHPDFPSTRLDPGQVYRQVSVYRFGVVGR